MSELIGKRALVTGACGVLGRALPWRWPAKVQMSPSPMSARLTAQPRWYRRSRE
jgi:hypothetical protein